MVTWHAENLYGDGGRVWGVDTRQGSILDAGLDAALDSRALWQLPFSNKMFMAVFLYSR